MRVEDWLLLLLLVLLELEVGLELLLLLLLLLKRHRQDGEGLASAWHLLWLDNHGAQLVEQVEVVATGHATASALGAVLATEGVARSRVPLVAKLVDVVVLGHDAVAHRRAGERHVGVWHLSLIHI